MGTMTSHRPNFFLVRLLQDSLVVNSGYLLGLNLVGAVVGLAFWTLAARFYSPDEVGLASAVISIVILLAGIASLGLGIGLVRFLADADDPERMLNTAFTFVGLTSLAVGSVYLTGVQLWSPTLNFLGRRLDLALGFAGFLGLTTLGSLLQMVYVAFREARYAFWQVLAMNLLRLALLVALMSAGALGIVAAVAIGMGLANGLSLFGFMPLVVRGFRIRPRWSARAIKTLVPYSAGGYLADLLYRAPILLMPPLTLELLGAESSAHAYVGWMLGWLLASPGQALASSAFAEGSHAPDDLRRVLSRAMRYAMAVTTLLAVLTGLAAPWVLMPFGRCYADGAMHLLRWLAAAAPLVALNNLYFSVLRVQKRMGELVVLAALSAALSLAIPFFSLQRLGLVSSGIGWLAAQLLVAIGAGCGLLRVKKRAGCESEARSGVL